MKVTTKSYDNSCEVCKLSNAKKIISRRTRARSEIPFERVYYDLIQVEPRLSDISWVLHFQDDYTRMNFVYEAANKKQTTQLQVLKDFANFVRQQYGCEIRIWKLDHESALKSKFDNWVQENGYLVENSAPYTPEQNGAIERLGGVCHEDKSRIIQECSFT